MPATPEDALSAPPAADRQPAAAPQEPPAAASKLPPSIASAFAAAAYALQHGDPDGATAGAQAHPVQGQAQGQGLMPGLYASMVGEPSRDYYLRLFERFDALGKALPTWNFAAGLFTLPWCGLRGLWREAAVYALAAGGAVALWGLLLRPLLGLPPAIAHGIDATLALLAIAVPGLGANAVYWRHVRRHTLQAIGEAPTMAEAHARLARHAPTPARKRLAVLAGVLLATTAAAASWALAVRATATAQAAASWLAASPTLAAEATLQPIKDAEPSISTPAATTASTPLSTSTVAEPAAQPASPAAPSATSPATQPQVVAEAQPSEPQASFAAPAAATAAAAAAAAPAAAPALAPLPGQMVAAPIEPIEPIAKAAATPAPSAPASKPAQPSKSEQAKMDAAKAAQEKAAQEKAAQEKAAQEKAAREKAAAAKAAQAKAEAARPASAALEPGNYYINIGVFSDAANAGRVVDRLEKARLPALRQTLSSNKGEIVRVRSGPFAQQRRAEQAATRIRKMGLEATVFHHAPQERGSRR